MPNNTLFPRTRPMWRAWLRLSNDRDHDYHLSSTTTTTTTQPRSNRTCSFPLRLSSERLQAHPIPTAFPYRVAIPTFSAIGPPSLSRQAMTHILAAPHPQGSSREGGPTAVFVRRGSPFSFPSLRCMCACLRHVAGTREVKKGIQGGESVGRYGYCLPGLATCTTGCRMQASSFSLAPQRWLDFTRCTCVWFS